MISKMTKSKRGKEGRKISKRMGVNKMSNKCLIKRKMDKWGKAGMAGMLTSIKKKNKIQIKIRKKLNLMAERNKIRNLCKLMMMTTMIFDILMNLFLITLSYINTTLDV